MIAGLVLSVWGSAVTHLKAMEAPFWPDLLLGVGSLLGIVGPVLCLAVPAKSRAQGILLTAVLLGIVEASVRLKYGDATKLAFGSPGGLTGRLSLTAPLTALSYLLMVIFMSRLAGFLGRVDLRHKALRLAALGVLATAAWVTFLIFGSIASGGIAMTISLIVMVILWIGMFLLVWRFFQLTRELQLTILRRV